MKIHKTININEKPYHIRIGVHFLETDSKTKEFITQVIRSDPYPSPLPLLLTYFSLFSVAESFMSNFSLINEVSMGKFSFGSL